jgi:CBS domain containing-hemolysin-like protein
LDTKRNIIDLNKLSPPEKKMIGEILEIREKEVNKVMVPKNEVVALAYDTQLHEAVAMYQKYHYSRYPVYLEHLDQIVGTLYIKDIISFWNKYHDYPVVEFVRLPHFVYEDKPALNVFLELQRLKLSLGIVIDEFGGVSGIITVEDLIEEIVGDIEDEFDKKKKPLVEKISENEFYLNTRMELDDFCEKFGIAIDEDDVSTVGGLIIKYADRIPKVGEEIQYRNCLFTVVEATRRKINKVRVKKL